MRSEFYTEAELEQFRLDAIENNRKAAEICKARGVTIDPRIKRLQRKKPGTALAVLVALAMSACAPKPLKPLPAPPASVKEVLVPVKVPCVVKKPQTGPKAIDGEAILSKDLFGTVQDLLADTLDLRSDQDKADAAMTDPCGKAPQ